MHLTYAPLFSGSSGNAIYVSCGSTRLLVDAGVSGVRIEREMRALGLEPDTLNAILVTHEHIDHIKGIGVLSRRYDLPVYASEGTWRGILKSDVGTLGIKNVRAFTPDRDFFLGDLSIMPFSTPHDANQPVGFTFESGGAKLSIATDLGSVRESWFRHLDGSDSILLESNYDYGMLTGGSYPYELKRRIMGAHGHLSNEDAAFVATELTKGGTRQIILGHLSKENNYPDLARLTTEDALREADIDPERDVQLLVASREGNSGLYRVEKCFT